MESTETLVLNCENCHTTVDAGHKFCTACGFPVRGDEDEKRSFRLIVSSRQRLLVDASAQIKSAKNVIYVLAGVFLLIGLIVGFANDDFPGMIANVILALLYLVLAAWADKNPFGAILTGLILYLTVQIANAVIDPATIFSGIIIKVFCIAAFVKGIRSAQEAIRLREELEKFKAVPVDRL